LKLKYDKPLSNFACNSLPAPYTLGLWKNINPGYMPSAMELTQYADEHSYCPEDMEMAKGAPKDWRHHVIKTDTSKYVEAVAKARVFAQVNGGGAPPKKK